MALKKKKIVSLVLLAAIIAGGAYLYCNGNALIVRATERIATNALGVKVDIGSITLSWKKKLVTVNDLEVGNPPGYKSAHVMTADKILIGLNTASKKLIDFKNIDVKGSEIYFEMTPKGTNLTDLKKLANSSKQKEKAGNETIRVIVQQMEIDASVIHPRISFLKDQDIPPIKMPPVRISGIGQGKTGSNAGEVIVQVLTRYLTSAQSAITKSGVLNQIPNINTDAAKKTIDDTKNKLKSLF
ncbi:MAG TPA: hypothetical protein VGF14_01735 [Alphaproteobacteria bacterium]